MNRGALGDYISLVTRKNKNLESTRLVGVTADKEIINSPYAEKNTNLSICLLISNNQFVVRLINIELTKRLAIGLYKDKDLSVVSSQYHVFEVTNSNLLSEYLMLIFKKQLTELQMLYMCFGGIRGELGWKDFIKLPIFVPSLEIQQRIVNKYETLERIIRQKREINEKLERWMRSLFHIWFDNLEENQYSYKTFGELFTIVKGGRPPRGNREQEQRYFCKEGGIPSLTASDINQHNTKFVGYVEEYLTEEGLKRSKVQIISPHNLLFVGGGVNAPQLGKVKINFCNLTINSTLWALLSKCQDNLFSIPLTFSYFLIKENTFSLKQMINSSTDRVSFDLKSFESFEIKLPAQDLINKFNGLCEPLFEFQKQNEQIITKCLRLQKCIVESLD